VTATATDVREWAKTQPDLADSIPDRGPLPRAMRARYDEAHATDPGDDGYPGDPDATQAAPPPAQATAPAERKPRTGRQLASKKTLRERILGPGKGKAGKKAKTPRMPIADAVEEIWSDLAWLAAPVPPLQRMLYVQAPYAGVILEDTVRGTIIDPIVQPVVRNLEAIRAIDGLIGPPVFVTGITLTGGRVQVMNPDGSPQMAKAPDGTLQPITDFDARTKLMFIGLRHSLLQMTKVTGAQLEAVQARGEDRIKRGQQIDQLIAWIFGMPERPPDQSSAEEEAIRRAQDIFNAPPTPSSTANSGGRVYPPGATDAQGNSVNVMDGTGSGGA
jgi:hypothetical protein